MSVKMICGLALLCGCGAPQNAPTANAPEVESPESDEPLLDYDPATLVGFSLIANSPDVTKKASSFTLGARFEIAEGWHIYWINPGDSGLPTKIKVEETAALQIGDPMFPGPVRFESAGDIVNYGYRGTLIVPMEVVVTPIGEAIAIEAAASWLACRDDACVPGKGKSTLTLGAQTDPRLQESEAIVAALAAVPRPLSAVEALGAKIATKPGYGEAEVQLTLPVGHSAELFPEVEKLVVEAVHESNDTGEHYRWNLTVPTEEISLAVLSVRNQHATHSFTITSADLRLSK